jgi:hypothetical protein
MLGSSQCQYYIAMFYLQNIAKPLESLQLQLVRTWFYGLFFVQQTHGWLVLYKIIFIQID